MTESEKAAAFDQLAEVLTNQWADGSWSWWCGSPCGGEKVPTQVEAVADLIRWAERVAAVRRKTGRATSPGPTG